MAKRLTTERATRDRFLAPVKLFKIVFKIFLFGYPWGVWARGVINPGYLVIEVLMQKTLFYYLVKGYTYIVQGVDLLTQGLDLRKRGRDSVHGVEIVSQGLEIVSQGLELEKNITMSFPSHRRNNTHLIDLFSAPPPQNKWLGVLYFVFL
jgi:hypothetical protein